MEGTGRRWKEGRVYKIAHRLRGLCLGPCGGLSGPLAFLCSLALRGKKKQTHIRDTLREGF